MVQVLKQCGNELTRENVMRQAANLKDFELGLFLPKINTSPADYFRYEWASVSDRGPKGTPLGCATACLCLSQGKETPHHLSPQTVAQGTRAAVFSHPFRPRLAIAIVCSTENTI